MSLPVTILALAALLSPLPATALADDLDPKVKARVVDVEKKLADVESAYNDDNLAVAKAFFDAVAWDFDKIAKDYGGKFDVKHPEYAALKKRVEDWKATLASGETKKDDGPKLDSRAKYELQGVDRTLSFAERTVANNELRATTAYLEDAEKAFARIDQAYGLDRQHPDVAAITGRIEVVRKKLADIGAKAAADEAALGPLLKALNAASASARQAVKDADRVLRQVSSARSDFSRNQDVTALRGHVQKGSLLAEKVHSILPGASQAAVEFRRQYPDPYALSRRFPEARDVPSTLGLLESLPEDWDRSRAVYCEEFLTEAEDLVERHEEEIAEASGDASRKRLMADEAEVMVVAYAAVLADAVLAFYPGEDTDRTRRARALEPRIGKVAEAASRLRGDAAAADVARLRGARFPQTELAGGEWNDVEKLMREAYADFASDKELLKVAVSSPWDLRTEARWRDRWIVGTYRYVGGYVAAELPSGEVRVYSLSFRKEMDTDGSFGPLQVFGVGHSFPMLKENL